MKEVRHWVELSLIPGIGSKNFFKLLNHFGDPEKALRASRHALQQVPGLAATAIDAIRQGCPSELDKSLALIEQHTVTVVTFNDAAVNVIEKRKVKVRSWYLDISMIRKYWGSERLYHHTAPINMNYALLEALKIVKEEGLQQRWSRHLANHKILKAGLSAIGIKYIPESGYELPMLNAVSIPDGTDDVAMRKQLLNEFNIEIGGGLGAFKAKAWRIGLMGTASTPGNVLLFLSALEKCLADQGVEFEKGASIAAAIEQAGKAGTE